MESAQDKAAKAGVDYSYRVSRVALVIDSSGSMGGRGDEVADGFNEQLSAIVDVCDAPEAYVTVVEFEDFPRVVYRNEPAEKIPRMKPGDFRPGGMTAMIDGVDHAIDLLEQDGGPQDAYLVVIMTDGKENSSKGSRKQLAKKVEKLQATGAWTFVCMVRREDIKDILSAVPMPQGNVATYNPTVSGGVRTAYKGLAASTSVYYQAMSESMDGDSFAVNDFFTSKKKKDTTKD